jgi:hypothetical protein
MARVVAYRINDELTKLVAHLRKVIRGEFPEIVRSIYLLKEVILTCCH